MKVNDFEIKEITNPIKSPLPTAGKRTLWILLTLFFVSGCIQAAGQYSVLSCKGDVKTRKGGKFITLTSGSKISLKKGDALWIANGAAVQLRFPGGTQKIINGPRFTKVENLEKVQKKPSFLENLIKNIGIEELFFRQKQTMRGATRDPSSRLSHIKTAVPDMKEPPMAAGKEKQMNEALLFIEKAFDAAPIEKQVIIKARIYKLFNRDKQALKTVFYYYEEILNPKDKKKERMFIEPFLFNEFLPIVITFEPEGRDFVTFSSNFKLYWAAFSFNGIKIEEIEKTIDYRQKPQYTFKVKPGKRGSEKNKSHYLFIIADPRGLALEKYDDMEAVKKEFLRTVTPAASSGKAVGLGKVFIKINLK